MNPGRHHNRPRSGRRNFPAPRRAGPWRPAPQGAQLTAGAGHGLARTLSKLGYCSRSQAAELIAAGRVAVNGAVRRDIEWQVNPKADRVEVDGQPVRAARKLYVMLNKPRGLVTTSSDEQGRETVFKCLQAHGFPHLGAVGRLDRASEGLLLFTNDSLWAARLTDPASHVRKLYHVQIDCVPREEFLEQLRRGVHIDGGLLRVSNVSVLRTGERNSWLEIGLEEGRNRQIRRLLQALGVNVLRLVRVAIGPLQLGDLGKGKSRLLTAAEVETLASA